ncbi:hypothetical protein PPTG_24337 [Phytophthora nicotianae INRA-310]|uniref:Uncharacterized protein n=1 Tax=Phytophthora nicotianae (strain INRA-310) TaxID=761204 RepID=W2PIC7_PHYN3|nr:hypothetical protein PPTG_24337 [Phytophthora nicotianae INRA-310]ETM99988.1 hypothetical protein PPTG_24337 [Phytophthora nicotianae INRA-310]
MVEVRDSGALEKTHLREHFVRPLREHRHLRMAPFPLAAGVPATNLLEFHEGHLEDHAQSIDQKQCSLCGGCACCHLASVKVEAEEQVSKYEAEWQPMLRDIYAIDRHQYRGSRAAAFVNKH